MDLEQLEQEYKEKQAVARLQPDCSLKVKEQVLPPKWFNPLYLDPPHEVTSPDRVAVLAASMSVHGWVGDPLVGYILDNRLQLLSGTHRRAAAIIAKIRVPVILYTHAYIFEAYGDLDKWRKVMSSDVIDEDWGEL